MFHPKSMVSKVQIFLAFFPVDSKVENVVKLVGPGIIIFLKSRMVHKRNNTLCLLSYGDNSSRSCNVIVLYYLHTPETLALYYSCE